MLEGSQRSNLLLGLPALVLTMLLTAITTALSDSFMTEANLANLAARLLPLGLVALGQALVLLAGRIDLSVGSIMSLSTAIMALLSPSLGWWAIPLTLAAGLACGVFTATCVAGLGIDPLVMGLATAAVVKGITLLVLPSPGGDIDYAFHDLLFGSERPLGPPLLLCLLVYALFAVVMGWTRFGRTIYAFGSDPRAAFANGVSSTRIDLSVYALSGVFAATAGVALSIRILSGDPLIGEAYTNGIRH